MCHVTPRIPRSVKTSLSSVWMGTLGAGLNENVFCGPDILCNRMNISAAACMLGTGCSKLYQDVV